MLCGQSPYLKYVFKTLNNNQYWLKVWLFPVNQNNFAFLNEGMHDNKPSEKLEKVMFEMVVAMATSN